MIFGIVLCYPIFIFSQENNYWTQQPGAYGTLLNGAITSSVRDNSAMFYNPGADQFVEATNFSISTDFLYADFMTIEDLGTPSSGELYHQTVTTIPPMFAVSIKQKKNKDKWMFGLFNRQNVDITLETDIQNGDFQSQGAILGYRNRLREDWYGVGYSHRINENLGIGITQFVVNRSQRTFLDDSVWETENDSDQPSLSDSRFYTLNASAFGLIYRVGLSYQKEDWDLGLVLTAPMINVNFIGNGNARIQSNISTGSESEFTLAVMQRAKTTWNTPWELDAGFSKKFSGFKLQGRLGWMSSVSSFNLISPNSSNSLYVGIPDSEQEEYNFKMARKFIVNVGIGLVIDVSHYGGIVLGFRSDLNTLDIPSLQNEPGITPSMTNWNLYHFSLGGDVSLFNMDLVLGLTASFGNGNTTAFESNGNVAYPPNEWANNNKARYFQLGFVIGYNYRFIPKEQKPKE